MSLQREDCIHAFDTGFIPKISDDRDGIIVTHSSRLISAVSSVRVGEYRIWGGSFIGGGGSTEATGRGGCRVSELEPTLGTPDAVNSGDGLARCASRSGHTMKNLPLHSLMSSSLQN